MRRSHETRGLSPGCCSNLCQLGASSSLLSPFSLVTTGSDHALEKRACRDFTFHESRSAVTSIHPMVEIAMTRDLRSRSPLDRRLRSNRCFTFCDFHSFLASVLLDSQNSDGLWVDGPNLSSYLTITMISGLRTS
jgi:hypothetical protein